MEMKYFAWMLVGIAFAVSIAVAISNYADGKTAQVAMQNGYEQVRDGNYNTPLWKKVK